MYEKNSYFDCSIKNRIKASKDVLALLRMFYHQERFSVHPKVNYIYNATTQSIQTSKPYYYHRLSHIQTVARFCQLENIAPQQSEYFLNLAMLNFRYGSKARSFLNTPHTSAPKKECSGV